MLCPRCFRRYDDEHQFCPHDGEKLAGAADVRRIRSKPTELYGELIGERYQVRGLIAKGAMGRVFLAQDKSGGEPVAVKVLDAKHLKEPRTRARFILEAKAAAKVVHQGIVKVLDVGLHTDGAPYLVMEFLYGESLGDFLRREKVMAPDRALPFLKQACAALAAAHRAGIIHRDIKPDNVFLLGEKGTPYGVKIVDFGFAKLDEHVGVTQMGVTVGTVEYMSPEQAVSDAVDARTDVYGMGALMYRAFSGRLPFDSAEMPDVMAHQLIVPPPPPALAGPLGAGLEAIILKAMRKRPENRYASMEALLDDLGRLASGRPLAAHGPAAEPDVYTPRSAYAQNAAQFFYKMLGKDYPAPP
jgi:serine/threonine protein kinase